MPPLILHNVPDDELYVGEDGVQRPYAMVFPSPDGHTTTSRQRKHTAETGSFGKSIRRSRSKTGTPAKREDPTLVAAENMFSEYLSNLSSQPSETTPRKSSLPSSASQPNLSSQTSAALSTADANVSAPSRFVHKQPTEVILRGFQSNHQYAAIQQYENIAGRICEDYPRDPPQELRRYKSDLRDPTSLRKRPLTPEEKAKALRFAGGENWIKVTFESHEAAESALYASPQVILGHLVYAEDYRGVPPTITDAIPATGVDRTFSTQERLMQRTDPEPSAFSSPGSRRLATLTRSITTPAMSQVGRGQNQSVSPPGSNNSSNTIDTGTLSTATASSATVTSPPQPSAQAMTSSTQSHMQDSSSVYCRRIPEAKRVTLLPASDALLPTKSLSQSILAGIPVLKDVFGGAIIGTEIPRKENGEFDWDKASLYWRLVWWLDKYTGLFGGDVAGDVGKED